MTVVFPAVRFRSHLVCAVLLAGFGPSGPADADDLAPPNQPADAPVCGRPLDLADRLAGHGEKLVHFWGRENIVPAGSSGFGVVYPATSFSPGPSPTRGGAGFELALAAPSKSACLSYRVRFPQEFDFVKGGKLPGLFGGEAPRGCVPDGEGFSARLMWRQDGQGELYLYAPGRDTRCGQSLGRGAWTFRPGAWTMVTQTVTMNRPGAADGAVRVWIDGRLAVEAAGLQLSQGQNPLVEGLLFSTFFGGGDPSWATPRDQMAGFADIALETLPEQPAPASR